MIKFLKEMKSFLICLLLFVAVVVGQHPPHPRWPNRFSSSVVIRNWGPDGNIDFARWFSDYERGLERIDGPARWLNELYWANRFFDQNKKTETAVFYQQETEVCVVRPFNHTFPRPHFRVSSFFFC